MKGQFDCAGALIMCCRRACLALAIGVAGLAMAVAVTPASGEVAVTTARPQTNAELERTKLQEEIRKLQDERRWDRRLLPYAAPIGTALVTTLGALFAIGRYLRGRGEQERAAIQQRERDSFRRFLTEFGRLGEALQDDNKPVRQANAAISLTQLTASDDSYASYRAQVFPVLTAVVKKAQLEASTYGDVLRRLLIGALSEALPQHAKTLAEEVGEERETERFITNPPAPEIDLSGSYLDGLELREVQLPPVRLCADGASLKGAVFSGSDLSKSSFVRADLTKATFYMATLKDADFSHAHCDGTHFQGGFGEGVKFIEATVTEADFLSRSLERAKFDGAVITRTRFA
jgi:hypothetical protein